jgi:hypothetical protein
MEVPVTARTPQDMRIAWVSVGGADENFYRQDERLQSQNHGVNDADRVNDVQKKPLEEADIFVRQQLVVVRVGIDVDLGHPTADLG